MKPNTLQDYAARKLKEDIKRLLKEPSAIAKPSELRTFWIPLFKKVAIQCGMNWDRLLSEGSPFEQERVRRIAAGQPHDAKSIGALSNERST